MKAPKARAADARPSGKKRKVDAAEMAELIREGKVPPHYAVAKAEGAAAVKAWIALLPEWQADRARCVDAVVTRQVPHVHKAVKWHGAWYGVPGQGWFLAVAAFKRHLKLGFFDGAFLTPLPPIHMATEPARALDVREADELDEARLAAWAQQASRLPGWGQA